MEKAKPDPKVRLCGVWFEADAGCLKPDVSRHLQNAAGISTDNLTECAAKISGAVIDVLELSVIEEVKRVDAKLERDTFASKRGDLCER